MPPLLRHHVVRAGSSPRPSGHRTQVRKNGFSESVAGVQNDEMLRRESAQAYTSYPDLGLVEGRKATTLLPYSGQGSPLEFPTAELEITPLAIGPRWEQLLDTKKRRELYHRQSGATSPPSSQVHLSEAFSGFFAIAASRQVPQIPDLEPHTFTAKSSMDLSRFYHVRCFSRSPSHFATALMPSVSG
jgi:hypothetical protein